MSLSYLVAGIGTIIGIVAAVVVLALLVGWYITTSNAIIRLRNAVEAAWSGIDVFLKKRYDLIPNLVETVKGYAKHEKDTLEAVINARSGAVNAGSPEQKMDADNQVNTNLRQLFMLTEAYPDLKADKNFLDLQRQLTALENEISPKRINYNERVRIYNDKIMTFPSSIVARFMRAEKKKFFEMPEIERQAPKVSF